MFWMNVHFINEISEGFPKSYNILGEGIQKSIFDRFSDEICGPTEICYYLPQKSIPIFNSFINYLSID